MILKKPFAFLIKYFRVIHLILLAPMIYLAIKTTSIANFLNDYINSNYSYTFLEKMPTDYINYFMYFIIILILLITFVIYYLMRHKKKPVKVYEFTIIYYIVFFVILVLAFNVLNTLENGVIIARDARAFRDIGLIAIIPQYLFILLILIRGIGFDIKKFNFAIDLKEMEIDTTDNEEFEFTVGFDGYKTKRTLKRFIREFGYYIKENTFIFISILVLIVIIIGTTIYFNYDVYDKTYKVNEAFAYKRLRVSVKDSVITELDYKNDIITKNQTYLAIMLEIANNSGVNYDFNYTDYRLYINNTWIYPILTKAEYFKDFGIDYRGESIKKNTKNIYALVFELPDNNILEDYELKIFNSNVSNKLGKISSSYTTVKIEPKNIKGITNTIVSSLKSEIKMNESNLKESTIKINEALIVNNYKYENELITVDYNLSKNLAKLIIIDYDLLIDENTSYYKNIKNMKEFFKDYLEIKYIYNGEEYITKPIIRDINNVDKLILQVNNNVSNATSIDLLFTVRDTRYLVNIK